jgi:hypothetical protein
LAKAGSEKFGEQWVSTEAHQRDKLVRFYCYVYRPAVSEKRLAQTMNGNVSFDGLPLEGITKLNLEGS